jgi:hypothetical protein
MVKAGMVISLVLNPSPNLFVAAAGQILQKPWSSPGEKVTMILDRTDPKS